jgi:hypothetical protein
MKLIVGSMLMSIVSGCAVGIKPNLDVAYTADTAQKGPLAEIPELSFDITEFRDERPIQEKIGIYRNAFDKIITSKVTTTKPVVQIVQEAIAEEFVRNGHLRNPDEKNIVITGAVTDCWIENLVYEEYAEITCTIQADIEIVSAQTNEVLLTRSYRGSYISRGVNSELTMSKALIRMVRQMSADPELLEVLKNMTG